MKPGAVSRVIAGGEIDQRFVGADPKAAAGADAAGHREKRGHDAKGVHAPNPAVVRVEDVNRAVTAHPFAVWEIQLQAGRRRGSVPVEPSDVRSGESMDRSVRGDLKNGMAVLVGDVDVRGVVRHG